MRKGAAAGLVAAAKQTKINFLTCSETSVGGVIGFTLQSFIKFAHTNKYTNKLLLS